MKAILIICFLSIISCNYLYDDFEDMFYSVKEFDDKDILDVSDIDPAILDLSPEEFRKYMEHERMRNLPFEEQKKAIGIKRTDSFIYDPVAEQPSPPKQPKIPSIPKQPVNTEDKHERKWYEKVFDWFKGEKKKEVKRRKKIFDPVFNQY